PGHARRCARPRVTVAVRLPDAPTAPVASRYSVPRPHRARPAAPASPTLTRSDVVTLPDPLLDAVRERVRNGLSDTTADRSLAEEIAGRVVAYLRNTAETTVSVDEDGTTFVITGDIPAMWLRVSAAQLMPLLRLVAVGVGAEEDRAMLVSLLSGLLRRHWQYIEIDPYANAFNRRPDNSHWDEDATEFDNPWAWERKFELDSLSYGPDLAWRLWSATGD